MNRLFATLPVTIFETMSALARETGAINLGQGFPDDTGPEDIRQKAADALMNGWNQYPPMMGLPELRQAIARHYGAHHGVALDAEREVMVTSGATEALAAALFALIEPGDEVLLIQPLYDAYLPLVLRAGGVPRFLTLTPPAWRLTEEALEQAFTPDIKLVVINTPVNPTGAMLSREELELLARYAEKNNAVVVSDEVWEHVTFDGRSHISVLAVPALRERAVKIGSAGKMFALTGWKVGFVCAAPKLLSFLAKAHQFLTFTTPPNLQVAVAYGLGKGEEFFAAQREALQAKRDYFSVGLRQCGFTVLPTAGTYFLNVDLAPLGVHDDARFAEQLVREAGVASIPVSSFFAENPVRTVLRFCFAKRGEVLDAALERLASFARSYAV